MQGKLIILSAPSGSGKTTIVKYLLDQRLPLEFSVSATSRNRREGETDGVDYYFISSEDFKKKIEENAFVEWEEVYPDCFYGTLKSEMERIWATGKSVILDMDVIGGLNVKKLYGDRALSIFIKPPTLDELWRRLEKRGTENKKTLQQRVEKAEFELSFADKFDAIVINDDLEKADEEVLNIVMAFIGDEFTVKH